MTCAPLPTLNGFFSAFLRKPMAQRFPLQAVLKVRQQKEEAEERVLTAIHAELQALRAGLLRLEQQLVQVQQARDAELQQVLTAAHHQTLATYWTSLRQRREELLQGVHTVELRRAEQMRTYLNARGARELLTELRDDHTGAWERQREMRDRKRADDLFLSRRTLKS